MNIYRLLIRFLFVIIMTLPMASMAGDSVGVIKTRDYIVEINQSGSDRRFTVKTIDGQIKAEQLSESEFAQQYPELRRYAEHSRQQNNKNKPAEPAN